MQDFRVEMVEVRQEERIAARIPGRAFVSLLAREGQDGERAIFLSKSGRRLGTADLRRRLRAWVRRAGTSPRRLRSMSRQNSASPTR